MKYILIIGAKSDLSKELAKLYSKDGYNLYLAGRNINNLENFKKELEEKFDINVNLKELDLNKYETHKIFYESLEPKPFGIILVSGYMADQKDCEMNFEKTFNTINVNYTGAVSILNIVANNLEKQNNGFIIAISSVAGVRGRKKNYIYGSSKAALTTYLSGLRNRLYKSNINVITVKPGFMYSRMTLGLKLPKRLTSFPNEVAKKIYYGQLNGKEIIYSKTIWRIIMFVIKIIPERIFKKTNF